MTLKPSHEVARGSEYVTLRAELLALNQSAVKTWQRGLLELVALMGLVGSQSLVMQAKLLGVPVDYSREVAISFSAIYLLGILIGWLEIRAANRLQLHADRIGAFLAVFHDLRPPRAQHGDVGWHVWNRVERILAGPRKRDAYVQDPFLSYYVAALSIYFASLVALSFFVLEPSLAKDCFKLGFPVFLVTMFLFCGYLIYSRKTSLQQRQQLTRDWQELAKGEGKIDKLMCHTGDPFIAEVCKTLGLLEKKKPRQIGN